MRELKRVYKVLGGEVVFKAQLIETEDDFIVRFDSGEIFNLDDEISFWDELGVVEHSGTVGDLFGLDYERI